MRHTLNAFHFQLVTVYKVCMSEMCPIYLKPEEVYLLVLVQFNAKTDHIRFLYAHIPSFMYPSNSEFHTIQF